MSSELERLSVEIEIVDIPKGNILASISRITDRFLKAKN